MTKTIVNHTKSQISSATNVIQSIIKAANFISNNAADKLNVIENIVTASVTGKNLQQSIKASKHKT
jgi:translation initiation factor 2B subunit (eIF-2B alpha/beta/delta family)